MQRNVLKTVTFCLWILCEIAIAACDLAEVIGTVIGLNLLFHMPFEIGDHNDPRYVLTTVHPASGHPQNGGIHSGTRDDCRSVLYYRDRTGAAALGECGNRPVAFAAIQISVFLQQRMPLYSNRHFGCDSDAAQSVFAFGPVQSRSVTNTVAGKKAGLPVQFV